MQKAAVQNLDSDPTNAASGLWNALDDTVKNQLLALADTAALSFPALSTSGKDSSNINPYEPSQEASDALGHRQDDEDLIVESRDVGRVGTADELFYERLQDAGLEDDSSSKSSDTSDSELEEVLWEYFPSAEPDIPTHADENANISGITKVEKGDEKKANSTDKFIDAINANPVELNEVNGPATGELVREEGGAKLYGLVYLLE
ncbi:hypothetical protein K469DRAFT_686133 [Zopfia rhizophila CBS 207.26]|uniref:Uncharacterized protein n=1 Tax=Zopfia rhizophila CBS 207.26 TaxID=1314779 RepID=A0A6A6E9T5_9PEZI|nr:hypothetical protein K469DRAFT_686133 [Zopfia rhizophila CBS 207.26]